MTIDHGFLVPANAADIAAAPRPIVRRG